MARNYGRLVNGWDSQPLSLNPKFISQDILRFSHSIPLVMSNGDFIRCWERVHFLTFLCDSVVALYVGQQLLGNLGALSFEEEILLLTADLSLYSVREC